MKESGRDLLLATMQHENTMRVPWVPFAGIHSGKLAGYKGIEIFKDGHKLLESLLAVHEVYKPDGQPVMFDLQVEAEILGCQLLWSENAPPSVASHPLAGTLEVPTHLPEKSQGRLPLILEVMQKFKGEVGDNTALFGLVTGPFTLASHLRGTDIFLDFVDHEDFLFDLLRYTTQVCKRMTDFYIDAGMDVLAIVDPLVSQISPRHFEHLLSKHLTELFAYIRQSGTSSSFFVCGDATKNIEVMCRTAPDCIAIDENINMAKAKRITDQYNIALSGNIPLTRHMLLGAPEDNMKYVLELLDTLSHRNLIISPGCDMPYDVPIENAVSVMQALHDPDKARAMLVDYQAAEISTNVQLPDYDKLTRPLLEVFTIDSETCPACGYMVSAAKRAVQELDGKVDLVEYKITKPENISRLKKMGIKNLPCMVINGQVKYSSVIPNNRELLESIQRVMSE